MKKTTNLIVNFVLSSSTRTYLVVYYNNIKVIFQLQTNNKKCLYYISFNSLITFLFFFF